MTNFSSLYSQKESFVLASSSPRRRELLDLCRLRFSVLVADIDETPAVGESPESLVLRLAEQKARAVIASERGQQSAANWFLAADTVVAIDEEILGKPQDEAEARAMLARLSGRAHGVWGGIAIISKSTEEHVIHSSVTQVEMVSLCPETISRYIASGEPMDKAGAYGIQGLASPFIQSLQGSYSNVVGLDLALVISSLHQVGIIE